MTQRELADKLNVTLKSISKWERNIVYPDDSSILKLVQTLEISKEELMYLKSISNPKQKEHGNIINIILIGVGIAMGVAVVVTSILGKIDIKSGFTMLGLGVSFLGIYLLNQK